MTKPDDFRGAEMSDESMSPHEETCKTCAFNVKSYCDRIAHRPLVPDTGRPSWCPGWMFIRAETTDPVREPAHYQARDGSGIECVDANRAMLTPAEFRGWLRGTLNKYLWRYRDKGGEEDLRKATQYLNWLKEHEERNR